MRVLRRRSKAQPPPADQGALIPGSGTHRTPGSGVA
jgi:hypothetical protein